MLCDHKEEGQTGDSCGQSWPVGCSLAGPGLVEFINPNIQNGLSVVGKCIHFHNDFA